MTSQVSKTLRNRGVVMVGIGYALQLTAIALLSPQGLGVEGAVVAFVLLTLLSYLFVNSYKMYACDRWAREKGSDKHGQNLQANLRGGQGFFCFVYIFSAVVGVGGLRLHLAGVVLLLLGAALSYVGNETLASAVPGFRGKPGLRGLR